MKSFRRVFGEAAARRRMRAHERGRLRGGPVVVEPLEPRILLSADAPCIIDIDADNRGLVIMTASRDLDADSVTRSNAVEVFTGGADEVLGTADDVEVSADVTYDAATGRIIVDADIDADTPYVVRVDASVVEGENGELLDGEFNGAGEDTGDGTAGGDLVFVSRPSAGNPIARITTPLGNIDFELFIDETPLSVANFLELANSGEFDISFFNRAVDGFVIQGGGFRAENQNDSGDAFERLDRPEEVPNELNRSNQRGTLAYALSGPNTATREFFFNLTDNSFLDTPSASNTSGFTVFGEVLGSSDLEVLDAIDALGTTNAGGGAFTDVPVLDLELVNDRGTVLASDLVAFERTAILNDVVGAEVGSLDPLGSITFESPNGNAAVQFFDLSGTSGLRSADFDVRFGRGDVVSSIRVMPGVSSSDFGIVISNASIVGSIFDGRADEGIGFIYSDAPINVVTVRGGIGGFNVNGTSIANVGLLPGDIAGDGTFDDPIAIYVEDATLGALNVNGDVTGDIVADRGVRVVNVLGQLRDSTIVSGDDDAGFLSVNLGSARDVGIDSEVAIARINAGNWRDGGFTRETIEAPRVASIFISGRGGLAGDFEVGLDLTGESGFQRTLNAFNAAGVFRSNWNIDGDVGSVLLRDGASSWRANISGGLGSLNVLGPVFAADLNVGDRANFVRAASWSGGGISSDVLNTFALFDRTDNNDVSVTVENSGNARVALNSAFVAGDLRGGVWSIDGRANTINVQADISGTTFQVNGDLIRFNGFDLRDTTIDVRGEGLNIVARRWESGELLGNDYRNVTMTGFRGDAGDFAADIDAGVIQRMTLARGGGIITSDIRAQRIENLNVTGDVFGSRIEFTQPVGATNASEAFVVQGRTIDSIIASSNTLDRVTLGTLESSSLLVGVPESVVGLPNADEIGQIDTRIGVLNLRILGVTGDRTAIQNGFIVVGGVQDGLILGADTFNGGRAFGFASNFTGSLNVVTGGRTINFTTDTPTFVSNDFQVRPNFAEPSDEMA
ncbi:MAG: peptidylprolyl isomerase [Planctomycetota bacterium]